MEFDKRNIKSTSRSSANVDPIVLRSNNLTRLVFKPMLVDNPKNPKASVKGTFIFQKKGTKEDWEDINTDGLNSLKKGEGYKLEIKSSELQNLMRELYALYTLFNKDGYNFENQTYIKTTGSLSEIGTVTTEDFQRFIELNSKGGISLFNKFIEWISQPGQDGAIVQRLFKLKPDQLERINELITQSAFQKLQLQWKLNYNNGDEEFWQELLTKNAYLLTSLLTSPVIFHEEKAYIGGKGLDNRGGNVIDFIYKNMLTDNVTLIEIKTPVTNLLGSKYRGVYSASKELSGSAIQVLNYRNELIRNFHSLNTNSTKKFSVFNPECLIIIGTTDQLDTEEKIESFELFRNSLTGVKVVTFNELFESINLLTKELN